MPSHPVDPLPRPVPCLDRRVDGLSLGDWPGRRGPLVCLTDPLGSLADLGAALGADLAPDWRVLSVALPVDLPYQAQAAQALWLVHTFGFDQTVLVGSGLGGTVALLMAAWYPARVAGLVLVNGGRRLSPNQRTRLTALATQQPAWRAWLDAPPACSRLERSLTCPVLRLSSRSARAVLLATRELLHSTVQFAACS